MTGLRSGLFPLALLCLLAACGASGADRPRILLVTTAAAVEDLVDFEWLEELRREGFEPNYLDSLADFRWDHIRKYNVLVLFSAPAPRTERSTVFKKNSYPRDAYFALVERFLREGGGVFFMAYTQNADDGLAPLLEPWGARIPFERFLEGDASRIAPMPRMTKNVNVVRIDDVLPSPISEGVEQLWWPYGEFYNGNFTNAISVSKDWSVVVRGSRTSRTEPVTHENTRRFQEPPPDPEVRADGVRSPALLAIREYGKGRILLTSQVPSFSIGQGTRWLFDRISLSRGLQGIPSDWEKMIHQSLRWLAAPSLGSGALGGAEIAAERLVPPNLRTGAREAVDRRWGLSNDPKRPPRARGRLHRGLIGAQSAASVGGGDVAEWAAAARRAGLDFLVFSESFAELDPKALKRLSEACRRHSDEDLLLLPGYTIDDNVGNHLFFYGQGLPWPPRFALHGMPPTLNLQMQDAKGRYLDKKTTHNWLLTEHQTFGASLQQIGFYHWDDPRAPRMYDVKDFSAAALRTYLDGRLVDDRTEDYLTTTQGTLPPLPMAVSLVRSPSALEAAVREGHALVYARAANLDEVEEQIGWSNAYDAPQVFVSDGPLIQEWVGNHRVMVYGAERFVADRELMLAPLHVTSDVGLAEIRIYDGRRLIRRFLPGGAETFRETLHLPGLPQTTLTVIAEDVSGGTAVSAARRSRKDGALGISFCGDRVNDCDFQPLLGRGIGVFPFHQHPFLPREEAGFVWDGGPSGYRPAVEFLQSTRHPWLKSNRGEEGERPFANLPILELADDQAAVARSVLDRVYDPAVPARTAWKTWGPLDPSRLFASVRRFTRFNRPSRGARASGYAFYGVRSGALVTRFENEITFREAQRVKTLRLAVSRASELPGVTLAHGGPGDFRVASWPESGKRPLELTVGRGEWFAVWADAPSNASFFLNRGEPVVVRSRGDRAGRRFELHADLAGERVAGGEVRRYDLLAVNDPFDAPQQGLDRLARLDAFLREPGVVLGRGRRRASQGLFEVEVEDGFAELTVPRPTPAAGTTLPVRVHGLQPGWSAFLYQWQGYTAGRYSDGEGVYSALGSDLEGLAYASLYPDLAAQTRVWIGHPVVADSAEVVIEAMPRPVSGAPGTAWHVAVNNPTDRPLRIRLRQVMALPGLELGERELTLAPGSHRVLIR